MEPLTILEPACYCLKKCKKGVSKNFCEKNFLSEVKKMAHHYGALLIFDEIISGFRFSLGGAQELTNVTPDLATFAKAISNAIPLSAIVGKKEYMSSLSNTFALVSPVTVRLTAAIDFIVSVEAVLSIAATDVSPDTVATAASVRVV